MDDLEEELRWGIDECSRAILGDRMGLLLDYVARFYKRQFITRREVEADWLGATDTWLEQFFGRDRLAIPLCLRPRRWPPEQVVRPPISTTH